MTPLDVQQQRMEIQVLKMCQHPNLIGMIDMFEDQENYYIVQEYMRGKDLFDYLDARNFNLTEQRVKEIAK